MGMMPGVHALRPATESSPQQLLVGSACIPGQENATLFGSRAILSRMYPHRIVSAVSVTPEHEDQPAHRARVRRASHRGAISLSLLRDGVTALARHRVDGRR